MIITVQDSNFDNEVTLSDKPVLIEFWAEWCRPCKAMKPLLAKIAQQHPEIKVCEIDIDENQVVSSTFKVRGAPFFMSFKNGKLYKQHSGTATENQLLDLLV